MTTDGNDEMRGEDQATRASMDPPLLDVSIVIPVHNEEQILEESVRNLIQGCSANGLSYELVLCENGSNDRTVEIARRLCEELPPVRLLRYPKPDYVGALNAGIQDARGKNIVCFEIDFFDIPFVEIAHVLLNKYEAVIGSKRAPGSRDRRPWIRRFITWGFNTFLGIFFRFRGTDTHGIKAFRAGLARPIAAACKTDRDVFATELVLRMERAGLRMCEIPLEIAEQRPAPINIFRRVPGTLKNLWRLRRALRGVKQSDRSPQAVSNRAKKDTHDTLV